MDTSARLLGRNFFDELALPYTHIRWGGGGGGGGGGL